MSKKEEIKHSLNLINSRTETLLELNRHRVNWVEGEFYKLCVTLLEDLDYHIKELRRSFK